MSDAYYEKIARINLTTGEIKAEPLDLEMAKKFIGGRGLGTKILYDEGVASVDPHPVNFDFPVSALIHAAEDIQDRALAGPAGTGNHNKLPFFHGKIDAVQRPDIHFTDVIRLDNITEFDIAHSQFLL